MPGVGFKIFFLTDAGTTASIFLPFNTELRNSSTTSFKILKLTPTLIISSVTEYVLDGHPVPTHAPGAGGVNISRFTDI